MDVANQITPVNRILGNMPRPGAKRPWFERTLGLSYMMIGMGPR